MDEPLSTLDARLRGFMRAELKHMQHHPGVTIIYVTHDRKKTMSHTHRVAVMKLRPLQHQGTPREIYDNPANLFVAEEIRHQRCRRRAVPVERRRYPACRRDQSGKGNARFSARGRASRGA